MNREMNNQAGVKESSADWTQASETGSKESIFPPELIQFARQIHVMFDWIDEYHRTNIGYRYTSDYDDHTDKMINLLSEAGEQISKIAGNEFLWTYVWESPFSESKKRYEQRKPKL